MESAIKAAILQRDRFTCIACRRRTPGKIHHILSPRLGGSNEPQNLVTLCGSCQMLASPIPVATLQRYFQLDERELLRRKAKVEIAIHRWVLRGPPLTPPPPITSEPSRTPKPPKSATRRTIVKKKARPRQGRVWTPDEDAALVADFHARLPFEALAARRGRGVFAVHVRLHKLGLGEVAHPYLDDLP